MWKPLLLAILTLVSISSAFAQRMKKEEPSIYIFDQNWKPCLPENAHYLVSENRLHDSTYQIMYYHYIGPLIRIETYRDKDQTVLHGFIAFYDAMGKVDSCGYFFEGEKDGLWMYFNDSLITYRTEKYERGKLKERKEDAQLKGERKEKVEKGYVLLPGEKEAKFKNGENDWRAYIGKNLKFPERAEKLNIGGKIRLRFMIDTQGYTRDIWLDQSVEYSIDNEAIRLITDSPKWSPAVKEGKNANAWRIQPITFSNPG